MKKRGKRSLRLLITVAVAILATAAFPQNLQDVRAAQTYRVLAQDDFTGSQIDLSTWLYFDEGGMGLVKDYDSFSVRKPYNGSGLYAKVPVDGAGQAEMRLDIARLDFGSAGSDNSGWIGFLFGAENADTEKAGLQYAFEQKSPWTLPYLVYENDRYRLVFYADFSDHWLVDGAGTALVNRGGYLLDTLTQMYPGGVLSDCSLRIRYDDQGNFSLEHSARGEENWTILARTQSSLLAPLPSGHMGIAFMDSAHPTNVLSADITDVVFTADGQSVAAFREGDSLIEEFIPYRHPMTESFLFSGQKHVNFNSRCENEEILVARQPVTLSQNVTRALTMEFDITLNNLAGGKQFAVALGMNKLNALPGSSDSSALIFEKNGEGYAFSLNTYEDLTGSGQLTAFTRIRSTPLPVSDDGIYHMRLEGDADGAFRVYADDRLLGEGEKVLLEGYAGFGVFGEYTTAERFAEVALDNVSLVNRYYESPANYNLFLDFEDKEINLNDWYVAGRAGDLNGGVYVRDGVLKFDNVAHGSCIATRYRYSNVQVDFDVTDIRRQAVYTPDGRKLYPISAWFAVQIGIDAPHVEDASTAFGDYWTRSPLITFDCYDQVDPWNKTLTTRITQVGFEQNGGIVVLPDKYDFWDISHQGDIVNIRVTMQDGIYTVALKYSYEQEYTEVLREDLGYTPTGYVAIWGMGDVMDMNQDRRHLAKYDIDNLRIANLDDPANVLDEPSEMRSNLPQAGEDYAYTDGDNPDDLIGGAWSKEDNGKGCSSSSALSVAASALLLAAMIGKRG